MKSSAVSMRRPIPLARSIRWDPVSASARAPALAEPRVFLTQGLIREVARHLGSAPDQELLGFFLGELFECPNSGQRYVVLFGASRTGYAIPEEDPVQIPEEQWLGAQLESRRRRIPLAGWYHGAPFVGAEPARLDVETQRQRFAEPWQCGIVMTPNAAGRGGTGSAGGVFRVRGPDAAYIPFHELLDDESFLEGGQRRTVVTWINYRTDELVAQEPAARTSAPRPSPPEPGPAAAGAGAGATRSTPAAGASATASRNTAILPVVIPSPSRTGEMEPVPPPERRRLRASMMALALLALIAAGLLAFVRSQRDLFAPGRSASPMAAAAPQRAAIDSLAARAGDSATSLAAAPAAAASAAAADSSGAPPPSPLAIRFDSLADSLESTIRNFSTRQGDFAARRVGCTTLATGYGAADDAFIALASEHQRVRDTLDSARDARYQDLANRMEAVNARFDASRCPRP